MRLKIEKKQKLRTVLEDADINSGELYMYAGDRNIYMRTDDGCVELDTGTHCDTNCLCPNKRVFRVSGKLIVEHEHEI